MSATVVVLGDVGRSPRMQYHALSLSRHGLRRVRVVGLAGEACLDELAKQENVEVVLLGDSKRLEGLPYALRAVVRAGVNFLGLVRALVWQAGGGEDFILVQNPPAIPTMVACLLARAWRGSRVVVDWHNLSYKMLEHGGRMPRAVVHVARKFEEVAAEASDAHLCVTHGLKHFLEHNFDLADVHVVHDRPFAAFQAAQHNTNKTSLLRRLCMEEKTLPSDLFAKRDDMAWLLSATSWTPDEDFSILMDGLGRYATDTSPATHKGIVMLITGKGPLKKQYEAKFAEFNAQHGSRVRIHTAWLTHADYPRLLSVCDLGVSMHTSTSGLDLPMKVVDMFGAGLPVLAMKFKCLPELVTDGENGRVFANEEELFHALRDVLAAAVDAKDSVLDKMRVRVKEIESTRGDWDANWERTAWPALREVMERGRVSRLEQVWHWWLVVYLVLGWVVFAVWGT